MGTQLLQAGERRGPLPQLLGDSTSRSLICVYYCYCNAGGVGTRHDHSAFFLETIRTIRSHLCGILARKPVDEGIEWWQSLWFESFRIQH